MTDSKAPSFEDLRISLAGAIDALETAINLPPDSPKGAALEAAASTATTAARAFIKASVSISAKATDFETRLASVQKAMESLNLSDHELGTGLRNDGIAVGLLLLGLLVGGLASLVANQRVWWGLIAATNLDIILVLLVVGFHGDTYYGPNKQPLKKHWSTKRLYALVPTKAFAIGFVTLLFAILWFSFGMLYTGYTSRVASTHTGFSMTMTDDRIEMTSTAPGAGKAPPVQLGEALRMSFLTLATFDGPHDDYPPALRRIVVVELVSAVFLVLGVFALAINRLSDFD